MPIRKTIEQAKEEISCISNGQTQLLSTEYINNKTPLLLRCRCGTVFERCLDKIVNRKSYLCVKCSQLHGAEMLRAKTNDVISYIESQGCKFISGDYVNNRTPLTLQCRCGDYFVKDFSHFQRGQIQCDKCWHKSLADQKRKYSKEDAKNIFNLRGYVLIGDYIDACTPVRCQCKNGHECDFILSQFLVNRSGCIKCMRDNQKGSKSHFYKDGRAKVQDLIRESLDEWKLQISERYHWKCPFTGARFEECDVHHINSLKNIYNQVISKYKIKVPLEGRLKDFPSYELFDTIRNEIIQAHDRNIGIYISAGIHRTFHKLYSQHNSTPQQFNEFLKTMYGTSLEEIQTQYP